MKTLLICPNQASGIPALADSRPAATLPFLGEHFLCYWMDHLANEKFTEIRIVTTDSADCIEDCIGDGSRWGMKIEIFEQMRELTSTEARERYHPSGEEGWPSEPGDLIEADHLPGLPEHKLFTSYKHFFDALALWMPQVIASKRIGLKEIQPGVWAGRKAHISRTSVLKGPCWIGDHVRIGKSAVVGPNTFLEQRVVLDEHCELTNSWIAPETFVGALTQVRDSLAWGDVLINWRTTSSTVIPDSFLLSSLGEKKQVVKRRAAVHSPAKEPVGRPFAPVISFVQKVQG